jgi:hypothetical protein
MAQCTHPDCSATATAKGLCPKHYMRLRRHGDAGSVMKAGRPKVTEPWVVLVHDSFRYLSPRTRSRFIRACRLMATHGLDRAPLIERATRGDGSMNMSAFLESVEVAIAFKFLDEHPESLAHDDEGAPEA